MKTAILNAHVIDPKNRLDGPADVAIADGHIVSVGSLPDGFSADRSIDAGGQLLLPGLVDLAARLREPGQSHKATIASETRAAAASGITSLIYPPDTRPVMDSTAVVELIHQRSEAAGLARVLCVGALTLGLGGERLADMQSLQDAGCIAVGNGQVPILSTDVLRRALEYAETCKLTVMLQAQDHWLSHDGCVHEGPVGTRLGLPGIPETAETISLARLLLLIESTGARVHVCRLSTARGAQMIAEARERGLPVSADVSISHLYLDDTAVEGFNSNAHLQPPLRSSQDRAGLQQAVAAGHISAICSDHQPHDRDAKMAPFTETEPGGSTLELLLPLTLGLSSQGLMDRSTAIAAVTSAPADLLGLESGCLSAGRRADLCLLDAGRQWQVDSDALLSAGHNCPFEGHSVHGRVSMTLLAGKPVFESHH